jgi:hypothetical protein
MAIFPPRLTQQGHGLQNPFTNWALHITDLPFWFL